MTVQGPVKEQQPDGMSHRGLSASKPRDRPPRDAPQAYSKMCPSLLHPDSQIRFDISGCQTYREAVLGDLGGWVLQNGHNVVQPMSSHTGKPLGVARSHRITWFQTQVILGTCQIRYRRHLWGHRSTLNLDSEKSSRVS